MELTLDQLIAELQNLRACHPEASKVKVVVDDCNLSNDVEFEDGAVCLYLE